MRILLLFLLVTGLSVTVSLGETYSCRDSNGRMHFSDSLQGLPDECLGKHQKVDQGSTDNLIFVPSVPPPEESEVEFKHSVREEERRQQGSQQQTFEMRMRAEKLLKRYQDASVEKRKAFRSWSYSSREVIKRADVEIARARDGKQQLLQELEDASLEEEEKEELISLLAGITEE